MRLRPRSASSLDALDALVAAQCDVELIRQTQGAAPVLARIGDALRVGSLDLGHLEHRASDHRPSYAPARPSARNRCAQAGGGASSKPTKRWTREARAALDARPGGSFFRSATFDALSWSLSNDIMARAAIGDVDLAAFIPKRNYAPSALAAHFSPEFAGSAVCGAPVIGYDGWCGRRAIARRRQAWQLGVAHHRRCDPGGTTGSPVSGATTESLARWSAACWRRAL